MDEDAAVEALDALGLSTYEAKVFIGLQKLGVGAAGDVAEVTDVPRSQVYGATDALAEYGLVDVQQGNPTRFRPVDIADAREQLVDRLETTADSAFEYIETVSGQYDEQEPRSEAIWTVSGTDPVSSRVASLVEDAGHRVVYGADEPAHFEDPVAQSLADAADQGVDVMVTSVDPPVGDVVDERFDDVTFHEIPDRRKPEESTSRMLLCDRDTVLVSVSPSDSMPQVSAETAFWSAGGAFATVLVTLIEERVGDLLGSEN
jgi:sugar-specific transcriptional regulator TrmB